MANELKDVMAYLLLQYKGRLSNTAMNELVYFADWHQVTNHGQQITGIKWRRSKYVGPFVPNIQNIAEKKHPDMFKTDKEEVVTSNYQGTERFFSLKDENFQPQLSDDAKKSLDQAIEEAKKFGDDFHEHVQTTSPLQNAQPGDFLKW